jgi:hypothetical protein
MKRNEEQVRGRDAALKQLAAVTAPPAIAADSTSKVATILQLIQLALTGLAGLPVVGPFAGLGEVFLGIYQNAAQLYEAETGQPFDVTKIPIEPPVS